MQYKEVKQKLHNSYKQKNEREKKMERKIRKNKGITLIALIIIIIVLLILSTITIIALMGDEGILKQVIKAGEETNRVNVEEQIKLVVLYGTYA